MEKFKIKNSQKLPGSIVEVAVEIPSESLLKHWTHAVGHVSEHIEIPGFRKGHIPEKVIVQKVGEMAILEDCAEHALEEVYPEIIKSEKLHPLGSPKVVITKIAKGNPLEATLRISVVPEITLPDYKTIAKKINSKKDDIAVEEKEVEDVINEIKKHHFKDENPSSAKAAAGRELTDETVKALGDFKDLADFKLKIKENLIKEKEYKAKEKKRIETIENIRRETKIDLPEVLVENELERMVHEFSAELARAGQTLEKYLSEIKKTEEDIKKEWKEKATERTQIELILFEIARLEKIEPKKEDVDTEVARMLEHYKTTPRERIVAFIEDALTKEEVFKFLEK